MGIGRLGGLTKYTRRGKITRDRCKGIKVGEDDQRRETSRERRGMRGKVTNTKYHRKLTE